MKKMNISALLAAASVMACSLFARKAEAETPIGNPFDVTTIAVPRAVAGTVRAKIDDPQAAIDSILATFEQFKAKNDELMAGKADVVLVEQVERINTSLGDMEATLNALSTQVSAGRLNGGEPGAPQDPEYSELFASFVREGGRDEEEKLKAAHRPGTPRAAMSEGSNTDGGYTTPIEWDRSINGRLKLISPIRQEATVQSISTAGFTKLFTDRAVGSGWVGETAARPATSTPQFTSLAFGLGEIYANAAASQQLLDDSEINIEAWLTGEIQTEFARQEGIAHLSGDGTNKPYGVLTYVTGAANAARHPWGDIKVTNSGHATLFTTDGLVGAVYELPAMYEPNAKFFLNRSSLGALRKLKDGQGNYIWQPTYVAGQPSTLLGRPVVDVPDMPNVGAGNIAALFGDMRETYLIVDRIGVRILRDPYTNKPYVCFYVTKRTGGGVQNPDSMKGIKISV